MSLFVECSGAELAESRNSAHNQKCNTWQKPCDCRDKSNNTLVGENSTFHIVVGSNGFIRFTAVNATRVVEAMDDVGRRKTSQQQDRENGNARGTVGRISMHGFCRVKAPKAQRAVATLFSQPTPPPAEAAFASRGDGGMANRSNCFVPLLLRAKKNKTPASSDCNSLLTALGGMVMLVGVVVEAIAELGGTRHKAKGG